MFVMTSNATRTLLAWVLLAALSGMAAVVAWRWTMTAADQVTHTLVVQKHLSRWLSAAQELESGQRAYLLTRDTVYLRPYESAKLEIDRVHSDLLGMADSDSQRAAINSINALLRRRLDIIEKGLAAFNAGSKTAEVAAEDAFGRHVMDDLRGQIADAKELEQTLFESRSEQYRRRSFWLLAAVLTTVLASAGLALLALLRERQRVSVLELSANALTTANRSLEQRVNDRTQELEIERDRAQAERERAEALLRDVTHRIGNTLSLVVGFINLHIRHTKDPGSLKTLTGARDRIHAIASAQRRINVTNDLDLVRIDSLIHSVLDDVVTASGEDKVTLEVDVPAFLAPAQVATSLCVLTQEFVVNSLKHAFNEGEEGTITVRVRKNGDKGANITVEDDGVGMTGHANHTTHDGETEGLGTKIAGLLTRQFDGEIRYEVKAPGAKRSGTRVIITLATLELTPADDDVEGVRS